MANTFQRANQNAQALDSLVGGPNANVPVPAGGTKPSWQKITDDINAAAEAQREQIDKSRGFRVRGTFAAGFTYELPNDVGTDASGNPWILVDSSEGNLPFTVPAGTVPLLPIYQQVAFSDLQSLTGLNNSSGLNTTLPRSVDLATATLDNAPIGTKYIINGGRYNVVAGSDTGGYYIATLANGNKLRLVPTNELKLSWIGQLTGDATSELQSFASISDELHVIFDYELNCTLSGNVNFTNAKSVDFGNSKINFNASTISTPVSIGSEDLTLVHTLTSSFGDGDKSITVSSALGLSVGDFISIWNPINGSWSGFRPEYRQGEYTQIARIDGSTLHFTKQIDDMYPVGSRIYKLEHCSTDLTGSLELSNAGAPAFCYGLLVNQNINNSYDGLSVVLNGGTHALQPTKCMNGKGKNMNIRQVHPSIITDDYGNIFVGCQSMRFDGIFYASRHGCAYGGSGSNGEAINRDCLVTGEVLTSGVGSVQAAELHGNCQRCGYGGFLEGYIAAGDDSYTLVGTKVVSPADNIVPVQFAEMLSMNHNLNGFIEGNGNDAGRGLVDLGGNSVSFDSNTVIGGVLDFSGVNVAGETTGGAFRIRNRGANVSYKIDWSGVQTSVPNSSIVYLVSTLSGTNPDEITFNNDDWINGVVIPAGIKLNGIRQKGSYTVTLDTSTNTMTSVVTFSNPFPAGYVPHISVTDDKGIVGSSIVQVYSSDQTVNNFVSSIYTIDRANFSSALDVDITWIAEA